jgi:hypothetical protein
MLWQDRADRIGHCTHQRRARNLQAHHRDMGIAGVDRVERAERALAPRVQLGRRILERPFDVGRGKGRAVVPDHVLAQIERVGLAVGRGFPPLGKLGMNFAVRIDPGQRAIDRTAGAETGDDRRDRRVYHRRIFFQRADDALGERLAERKPVRIQKQPTGTGTRQYITTICRYHSHSPSFVRAARICLFKTVRAIDDKSSPRRPSSQAD